MDIPISIVTGFIKIISKWSKKLFHSGATLITFYFKVRQRDLFKGWTKFVSKWGSYFKVEHNISTTKDFHVVIFNNKKNEFQLRNVSEDVTILKKFCLA